MKLCIYHGGCTDGIAAAWVVWKHAQEIGEKCAFYPGAYGKEPPWDMIGCADEVLLVDFSYGRGDLLRIIELTNGMVTVLDHHASAAQNIGDIVGKKCAGIIDQSKCGARITCDWYFSNRIAPPLLLEIDKQDRWLDDRDPELIMSLRSHPHSPAGDSSEDWESLMALWSFFMTPEGTKQLRKDGKAIYRYYSQRLAELKHLARETVVPIGFSHVTLPVVNAHFAFASDLAGQLAEEAPSKVAMTWYRRKDGKVSFSVRSREGAEVTARKLAETYNGGGHEHAAGFSLDWDEATEMLR